MMHETSIADAAERLWDELPGHRVEILNGSIVVTPPPDGPHQEVCSDVVYEFRQAGGREAGLKAVPGIGLWLPTGPDDYAIPDLSIVDADYRDALVEKNCYAPHVFRLAVEVTSTNWSNDLMIKVGTYAAAGIPVYLVVDRKHDVVLVHTDPGTDGYDNCVTYKRGATVPVPDSVGIELEFSVDRLLDGDDAG
ncbi:Uma2 family endonuclease [Streptomyces sp. TRM66268-LWL]|uniref:Uma2 family endonuclease n=1 Tax=Streptomyces polyasparticus TaxID=2767826 RepID=A0ABR7SRH2_9ACTN|nr:Uma2 family endonuclease [Streptomyces polyasparticus]MBC9718110.1 Uma2 family endonuclease [Streptomyces polyasparticus]